MLDVMVKRLHEYKRQMLKLLHVVTQYESIVSGRVAASDVQPRTVIFGAKAPANQAIRSTPSSTATTTPAITTTRGTAVRAPGSGSGAAASVGSGSTAAGVGGFGAGRTTGGSGERGPPTLGGV